MNKIYAEVKTPFKYGIVVRGAKGQLVDCPSVFNYKNKWYMMYIGMEEKGYETYLAESDDLLHWQSLGKILSFTGHGWDALQKAGYVALQDPLWGGSGRLLRYEGKYWLSYLGGVLPGYETEPLAIGIAWSTTPNLALEWHKLPQPVLTRDQADVRAFEKQTLYKSYILHDEAEQLGSSYVMFYNGKAKDGHEQIGMAVSSDMVNWQRFGKNSVIDNRSGISGDPQVVRIGDLWVMFYFGAFWKPGAFDTFACSHDLIHWTKWEGEHLVKSSEPWDAKYAHKPWVIKANGIVYHFYCAVGNQGRVIALATSVNLKKGIQNSNN
jgi:predicted GH43/DUF377 family glycosyl hydrolase